MVMFPKQRTAVGLRQLIHPDRHKWLWRPSIASQQKVLHSSISSQQILQWTAFLLSNKRLTKAQLAVFGIHEVTANDYAKFREMEAKAREMQKKGREEKAREEILFAYKQTFRAISRYYHMRVDIQILGNKILHNHGMYNLRGVLEFIASQHTTKRQDTQTRLDHIAKAPKFRDIFQNLCRERCLQQPDAENARTTICRRLPSYHHGNDEKIVVDCRQSGLGPLVSLSVESYLRYHGNSYYLRSEDGEVFVPGGIQI